MNFALVYPGERTRFAITATLAILFWIAVILGTLGIALLYVLFIFIIYAFAQSAFISYLRGTAVKITPEQFPELHAQLQACCERLEMKQVPDAYLLHADGFFNALATRFLGRDYVVLFSSVVDALAERPAALDFYMGHELGHIRQKHLGWGPVLAPMAWLPLLGAALRRAQEYTCDRHGLRCCPDPADAHAGMAALAAGHSRWPQLNLAAYRHQRFEVTGFWASFHEFTSDYPWTVKRAWALEELSQGREPKQRGRSFLAGVLALFVPRIPGAGGAGFLVVIAMIGVLAAIALPAYQDYNKRALTAEALMHSLTDRQLLEAHALETGQWPESLEEIQMPETGFKAGKADVDLSLGANGVLQYSFNGGGFQGETLQVIPEPVFEDDTLAGMKWSCASDDLEAKYLPAACR
jgi:Zn-dependent protease with chaperone function